MEAHSDGQIPSVVILSKESGFSQIPNSIVIYLSVLNIPETAGLGTERVFLGAREEESTWDRSYCLHFR
jgi:hypothetical protein